MSELARLPARGVLAYAIACLEHQAAELASAIDVAIVPVEAFGGGCRLRKRLEREIRRRLGESMSAAIVPGEQAAIADVEREIALEFPFYFAEARLNMMHERLGMLRLAGP